jgi:hypothetical protein|nr:hypothetical protein [uncultured Dysosmobacter sp.]
MSSIERPNCYTAEEWKKVKGQFNTDFKRYNDHIKSFNTLINEILDGETEGTFAQKTGLSNNMFSRIRNYVNKKDPPQRSTLISIAVGYNLDFQITARLLESLGSGFTLSNERDYAYQFILTNCRGKSVDDCNEILKCLGVEEKYWLGAHARRSKNNN